MAKKKKKAKMAKPVKTVQREKAVTVAAAMTPVEYVECVKKLDRSIRAASEMLGVAVRQSQRFSTGETRVPLPVQKLLRVAVEAGVSGDRVESL